MTKRAPDSPTGRPTRPVGSTPVPTSANASVLPVSVAPTSAQRTGRRAASLRSRLSDRDLAVLDDLRRFKLMTAAHLKQLHMTDGSTTTQVRRTSAMVKRLTDFGLVVRLGRRVGGVRAGSSGFVLGLTGLGHAVLGDTDQQRRYRHTWEGKPHHQDHTLAIAELYTQLTQACRTSGADLIDFETEPACWRKFSSVAGVTTLKPDAFVQVGVGDIEQLAFVEVDRGTESLPAVLRKCRTYIAYFNTGQEQKRHEVFPLVHWLVPDARRLQRIAEGIGQLARDVQALFAVNLFADGPHLLTDTKGGSA